MRDQLTREQVVAIADQLDEVVGNHFHDSVVAALHAVGWDGCGDEGISDEEDYNVKVELALGYLKEYQDFYDKKHGDAI